MRLRLILFVLALLAFSSASIGGYLYYNALKESAYKDASLQTASRAELIRRNLSFLLTRHLRTVRTLAAMAPLPEFLENPSPAALDRTHAILDLFNSTLETDVCYLLNLDGITVASTNRRAPDSFLGMDFSFRPYFKDARENAPATYMAVGTASNKRGVYYGYPVFLKDKAARIGVLVIKSSIDSIENELDLDADEIVLVTDPRGVIFISNRKDWIFHLLKAPTPEQSVEIAASRQFGEGPWRWVGLGFEDGENVRDADGRRYLSHTVAMPEPYPGWRVMLLKDLEGIRRKVSAPLAATIGPIVLSLCLLVGCSVFFLYRKASQEIEYRRRMEKALRKSEERYRSLYHHTPAMMHSIDAQGRLLSVSDHWSDALGYSREEAVGKPLTDFFTPESRRYAMQVMIPAFFKTGHCKDVPYQFVRRDGRRMDVLLSAIADRNEAGEILRSLAVSIDVTEQKKAQKDLHRAKEALSAYSSELERQVAERTREITGILRYTPAVIYIKDREGRYVLVNSRFEDIFNIRNEAIRGRTDREVLPPVVFEQFEANDRTVLTEKKPCQFTEHIPQADAEHTYLSVKFPIYDDEGNVTTVCGIGTDITELKVAQDRLRRLSGKILSNQERERAAMARELHDELGQMLTALRMDVVWIRERLSESDTKGAERAALMCQLIDQSIANVRDMAIRLRPGVLDDLGLVDALEWFTTSFEKRTGITCIFEHENVPVLKDAVATAAYRVAQEALTNVTRHASARQVTVKLKADDAGLFLCVMDDGKGFNPPQSTDLEGLGLSGMRERAALVSGTLHIASEPGKGTRISLTIPLSNAGVIRS